MKRKLIALICIIALMLPMALLPAQAATNLSAESNWTNYQLKNTPDYSFAVLGDFQYLTAHDVDTGHRYTQNLFSWILDNQEARNIQYVFGLGDSINTIPSYPEDGYSTSTHNPAEWKLAASQFARLDGKIPYIVVRGNHDDEAGFNKYIATSDYKKQMSGFFYDTTKASKDGNSLSNSFRKITIGNEKYLMLGLDYDIYNNTAVQNWANEVIAANPDCRVIVTIHAYNNENGGLLSEDTGKNGTDQSDGQPYWDFSYVSGQKLWDNIFSKHANIAAILCGHVAVDQPVITTRTGSKGNKVVEILVDPQALDDERALDGSRRCGFVFMINVSNGGNTWEFEYISTARENDAATAFNNTNKFHLKSFQDSSSVVKTINVTVAQNPYQINTQATASVRISTENAGLRFKTNILKSDVDLLIQKYGKANVSVGTLIAPTDTLGINELTHKFGTKGTDYVEVMATVDQPFADTGDYLVYAGSLSKIKQENLDRNFTAVGFIAYKDGTGTHYIYSNSFATRNVDYVATKALTDNDTNYTFAQKIILESLTLKAYKDPFGKDPF